MGDIKPQPGKKTLHPNQPCCDEHCGTITMHGYVCMPEPCPPRMCTKIAHLPCNVEGEDLPGKLTQLLGQHQGYTISQVLDHGHDGWTIILNGPC